MSEEKLNEQYIIDHIQGICQDCIYLDKIVPIIREMLSEAYINGLEQSRFDKQMLELENQEYKEVLNKISDIINYEYNFYDDITNMKNDIENILKEVK